VYEAIRNSHGFEKDLRFLSQIQAAAVSSMSNIAEGFSRQSIREFIQYLFISKGSAAEVQSQLYETFAQPGGNHHCHVRNARKTKKF
jgi:four helix bundle protein